MKKKLFSALMASIALGATSCTASITDGRGPGDSLSPSIPSEGVRSGLDPDVAEMAYGSTYKRPATTPVAIVNVHILSAAGPDIEDGTIVLRDGRIAAIGSADTIVSPSDATIVPGNGRWVTPGLVDPHSHIGLDETFGRENSNETSSPVNPGLWIEHGVWPQAPMFERALEGGVTTLQILPGSAGLINGRTVVLKNVAATSVGAMKFPGAKPGVKLACGENPISIFGGRGVTPMNRAAEMLGYRTAFLDATDYAAKWDAYRQEPGGGTSVEAPKRDIALDTMADILRGKLNVHIHCYRADEMMKMIDLSHEFGFRITAFHHAIEAYKMAPVLAREHIAVVTWSGDWSGYKMEALDSIMENAPAVEAAGGIATMHSDDPEYQQQLNGLAARTLFAARQAGMTVSEDQALRWITINPARILGVDGRTGSLEVGKDADLVLWSASPFSVYARTDQVYIDGALLFDRGSPAPFRSDFEFGNGERRSEIGKPQPVPVFPRSAAGLAAGDAR